jgi:hypothetical protein
MEPYQYFLLGIIAAWTPSMAITVLLFVRPAPSEPNLER